MSEDIKILDYLKRLEATTKRNEKIKILKEISTSDSNELFQLVCTATYDPRLDYYVKDIELPEGSEDDFAPLGQVISDLKNIIGGRVFTGNQAKQWIQQQCQLLSEDNIEVLRRIIERNLKCGISATTINKVWPNLIYIHPYMRCAGFSEKTLKNISFPCFSQYKIDGLYCDIIVTEDKVEYVSRSGKDLELNDEERDNALINYILDHYGEEYVLQGEVIVYDDEGNILPREESNGVINSDTRDMDKITFWLWDIVPYSDFKKMKSDRGYTYDQRYDELSSIFNRGLDEAYKLFPVETKICSSKRDIIDHFKEARELGEEGTVIKDYSGQWAHGTPKHQIKVKVVIEVELKVVDYKMGKGKHEGKLGGLICRTQDDLLEVSIGGGYKDTERQEFLNYVDSWIESGQIVTVKTNDICKNQDDEALYSLFLPRFKEVRLDKTEADTLDSIRKQIESFTDMLELIK